MIFLTIMNWINVILQASCLRKCLTTWVTFVTATNNFILFKTYFIDKWYLYKTFFFQFSAQQALEKIDRTRGHAAHLFATLVTSKDVQYIPHKDQVLQCFPEKIRQSGSDFDEFGWSVESQTFPIFAKLLRLKSYTKATLLGLYHVCTYF